MNRSWCYQIILVVIIFNLVPNVVSKFNNSVSPVENQSKDTEYISPDFAQFMEQLASIVYKNKQLNKKNPKKDSRRTNVINKPKPKPLRQNSSKTLNDLLMLKLVSYYEDKYKVANQSREEKRPVSEMITRRNKIGVDDAGSNRPNAHYAQSKRVIPKRESANVHHTQQSIFDVISKSDEVKVTDYLTNGRNGQNTHSKRLVVPTQVPLSQESVFDVIDRSDEAKGNIYVRNGNNGPHAYSQRVAPVQFPSESHYLSQESVFDAIFRSNEMHAPEYTNNLGNIHSERITAVQGWMPDRKTMPIPSPARIPPSSSSDEVVV